MKKGITIVASAFVMILISLLSFNAYANDNTDAVQLNSKNTTVVLSNTSYTYSATEKTPNSSVYYTNAKTKEKIVLKKGKDYTLTYSNNIDAGTAKAIITGIGDYKGKVTESFTIKPISLSHGDNSKISLSYTETIYSGKNKTPKVTVYCTNGQKKVQLKRNVDYTITYKNNVYPGKASVVIKGINNYSSSVTKTYKIKPKKVTGFKATSTSTTSVTLKWNSQPNVSGYKIYRYSATSKSFKLVATVSSKHNTYTVKNLYAGYAQVFKVRSYKTVGDYKYYGEFANAVKTGTHPSKVTLNKVAKGSNGTTIKVSWDKVKCTSYQIIYSTDKDFDSSVKTINISNPDKTSYTIKNISKSNTYYVKVRACLTYDGKKYYGSYSQRMGTNYSNLYATYSTQYVDNANRTTNLKIASKAISGTIVKPGETFSFNEVVGPRTVEKGYKEAGVFSGGGVVDQTGGGICQVASTMFNCVLLSNVSIVERHQHSQRVTYVPLGRDAAIYGTAEDFRWKNNTNYSIKVVMTVKDGTISCSFYTCEDVKPKKVTLKVTQSGNNFTLKRSVDGKVNYTCYSTY